MRSVVVLNNLPIERRIIMANMNSDEIKEVFDKNGLPPEKHWDEITSLDALKNELSKNIY